MAEHSQKRAGSVSRHNGGGMCVGLIGLSREAASCWDATRVCLALLRITKPMENKLGGTPRQPCLEKLRFVIGEMPFLSPSLHGSLLVGLHKLR